MLENLYSLQSTWMWVGTAKAEPHCCVYQLLFQAQITLLLLYSTTHLFNKKKKGGKKLWFIFPLHRNCNISLWLFPPLSEEISAIKIAISALKCCIKPFEALLILFILHIAGRMSPRIWILFAYIYRRRLSYRPSVWWWSHSARSALHLYYFLYFLINC